MRYFTERIWASGEYSYEGAYGFIPKITAYLHDDNQVRPCMLVVPGGGYCMVVDVEADPVAREFYERGMNAFVLTYTTDITFSAPLKKQPLKDLSRAIRYIRKNAERFCINASKLSICGFSAGGHLCGSIATHYEDVEDVADYAGFSNRPDAVVLSYPVITAGRYTHTYSMSALSYEEAEYFSIEKHVKPDTPPCFIWQTVEDDLVPVENSMMMAESCRAQGVPYAYYAFPHGRHGLSVCNDQCRRGDFGEKYTFEQLDKVIEALKAGKLVNVPEQRINELKEQFHIGEEQSKDDQTSSKTTADDEVPAQPTQDAAAGEASEEATEAISEVADGNGEDPFFLHPDVAMWPSLCEIWLREMNLL